MPLFLDFEAYGLGPASYPVEVAWGDTDTGEVEAHLIAIWITVSRLWGTRG